MAAKVIHVEVVGKDGSGLQKFYSDVFDWTLDTNNPGGYGMLRQGDGLTGGIGTSADGGAGHVTFYVHADDPAGTLARVEAAGGRVIMPLTRSPPRRPSPSSPIPRATSSASCSRDSREAPLVRRGSQGRSGSPTGVWPSLKGYDPRMGASRSPERPGAPREPAAPELTGEQIAAISRFPDQNPHPVMRVRADGELMYANTSSAGLVGAMGATLRATVPEPWLGRIREAAMSGAPFEVVVGTATFDVLAVDVPDFGFTNLYGSDITARKAVARFPDKNPNPVFRLDWEGRIVYANPASEDLIGGLGSRTGRAIEAGLWEQIRGRLGSAEDARLEVSSASRTYALRPVDVPEFGFINVYGTDITAAKALEQLHLENERLLLNILPEPIADRLRRGERLIADRFEDVTLLFADIVGFTELSSAMQPDELVAVLNDTFTRLRRPRRGARAREGKDDRRRLHGRGRPHRSGARPHRASGADGHRPGRPRGRHPGRGTPRDPVPGGGQLRPGRRRRDRDQEVHLRHLGRHREPRQPHGVIRRPRPDPGPGGCRAAPPGGFRLSARGLVDIKGKGQIPTWFLDGEARSADLDALPARA